jgi:hypothetical protein
MFSFPFLVLGHPSLRSHPPSLLIALPCAEYALILFFFGVRFLPPPHVSELTEILSKQILLPPVESSSSGGFVNPKIHFWIPV